MSPSAPHWKTSLAQAVRQSPAQVFGFNRIDYAQHARLVLLAVQAFGQNANATFYIDGLPAEGDMPRPDLIILSPEIGVLVIENKGVPLEAIHAVDHHTLQIVRDGILKHEDPYHQAENVMYALKDLCKVRFDPSHALFLRAVAFPRIRRSEFELRFNQTFPQETLFDDAFVSPAEFREQVLAYAKAGLRTAPKAHRLSRHAHDAILTILSGRALFHPARKRLIPQTDPKYLGVQIQTLELATREATQQQKDLGRADLRGAHRLFRGVAGSGKSIMLSLSAAQTLVLNREDAQSLFETPRKKRVLVLCFNRTLVQYLRARIDERFCRIAWDKPAEEELTVSHFEGYIRQMERREPRLRTGLDFTQKEKRAVAFCKKLDALPAAARDVLCVDAIYVDEAQDLLPEEFQIIRRLIRPDADGGQTLILFYDNAQNIYGKPAATWGTLGINIVGRTVFLDTCLRNTREILKFALNVLVGSFAPAGVRVSTRQFADVASLKQRGLIEETGDILEVLFSQRNGPPPIVSVHADRAAEIDGIVRELHRLFTREHVLPSDVLIVYRSHAAFDGMLPAAIQNILPPGYAIRHVDKAHGRNKNLPLIEDGFITLSTIASAKGYDAPVVFLAGADQLADDEKGRATFYVAATRAKLCLYVSAVQEPAATTGLVPEILQAAGHANAMISASRTALRRDEDEPSRYQDLAAPPDLETRAE